MDDPFINQFYGEYIKGYLNIERFYTKQPEIIFIKEKYPENEIIINLNDINSFMSFFDNSNIKKVQLSIVSKTDFQELTTFSCIGIFINNNLLHQRFSHQIILKDGKIIIEKLIILDEKIKFDNKNLLIIEDSNISSIEQLIHKFSKYGEIVQIEHNDYKSFKLVFKTEDQKKFALNSYKKR